MSDLIPFGKYKGEPFASVAMRDPQYIRWIQQQQWFQDRFPHLLSITVNQFGVEPENTPEHNAMVAQLLDENYLNMMTKAIISDFYSNLPWVFEKILMPPVFEAGGWDAIFRFSADDGKRGEDEGSVWFSAMIEFKPLIGDDFSSVIRQVVNLRSRGRPKEMEGSYGSTVFVVVARSVELTSVTFRQVKAMFDSQKIHLLLERDFASL